MRRSVAWLDFRKKMDSKREQPPAFAFSFLANVIECPQTVGQAAQAEFWNDGMSRTSGGLSTLTTHLEKRDKRLRLSLVDIDF